MDEKMLDLIYDEVKSIREDSQDLKEDMITVKFELAENGKDLKYHIKRTDLNEKRLAIIEKKLTLSYLLKVVSSTIITAGGVATAIYKIFDLF